METAVGTYNDPANYAGIIPWFLFNTTDASLHIFDVIFGGILPTNNTITNWTAICESPENIFGLFGSSFVIFVACSLYPNVTRNIADGTLPANWTDVGFDPNQTSLSKELRSSIPTCLASYCSQEADCAQTALCTTGNLLTDGYELSAEGIAKCWLQLCTESVNTVNADIAGVGILASYVAQSIIALFGLFALTGIWIFEMFINRTTPSNLQRRPSTSSRSTKVSKTIIQKHEEEEEEADDQSSIFIFILADFHKAQCFFSIALQIATLIVLYSSSVTLDYADTNVLLIVSADGLIPIAANLYTLMTFGSQDWYPIALSVASIILSSIVGASIVHELLYTNPITTSNASGGDWPAICGYKGPAGICEGLGPNLVDYNDGSVYFLAVLILMSVTVCGLVMWKFFTESRNATSKLLNTVPLKFLYKPQRSVKIGLHTVTVLMLLVCFVIEFYFFYILFHGPLIDNKDWGFGQIVGITIWSGSVIELAYLELRGLAKGTQWRFIKSPIEQKPEPVEPLVSVDADEKKNIRYETSTSLNLED